MLSSPGAAALLQCFINTSLKTKPCSLFSMFLVCKIVKAVSPRLLHYLQAGHNIKHRSNGSNMNFLNLTEHVPLFVFSRGWSPRSRWRAAPPTPGPWSTCSTPSPPTTCPGVAAVSPVVSTLLLQARAAGLAQRLPLLQPDQDRAPLHRGRLLPAPGPPLPRCTPHRHLSG